MCDLLGWTSILPYIHLLSLTISIDLKNGFLFKEEDDSSWFVLTQDTLSSYDGPDKNELIFSIPLKIFKYKQFERESKQIFQFSQGDQHDIIKLELSCDDIDDFNKWNQSFSTVWNDESVSFVCFILSDFVHSL